jgi:anti-sigma factor RsiW
MTPHEEQLLLAAYHDGELDPPARRRVEDHLRDCPTCAAELERLAAASRLLHPLRAEFPDRRTLRHFHEAIDDAAADDARFVRTAASIAVIAASVLIVGLAWLRVLAPQPATAPAPPTGAGLAGTWSSREQAWEHVATTLRPDPLTLPARPDRTGVAANYGYDAGVAEWMLSGLNSPQRAER